MQGAFPSHRRITQCVGTRHTNRDGVKVLSLIISQPGRCTPGADHRVSGLRHMGEIIGEMCKVGLGVRVSLSFRRLSDSDICMAKCQSDTLPRNTGFSC